MTMLVALTLVGLGLISLILSIRWCDARDWAASLVAYELRFPRSLDEKAVLAWLGTLAATTRRSPVVLEVVATHTGIRHFLLLPESMATAVLPQLRSALPGVNTREAPGHFTNRPAVALAAEYRLTNRLHALAHDRAEASVSATLALLHPLARGEVVRIAWTLSGARPVKLNSKATPEEQRAWRSKYGSLPMFNAVGRVAISAPTMGRAVNLVDRITSAFQVLSTPEVSVVRRWLPAEVVTSRVARRSLPLAVWPCQLNTAEALGVVSIPFGSVQVAGLNLGGSRQMAPPPSLAQHGLVVGLSNLPGMEQRCLALKTKDRLRHSFLLGPTGSGKSELLAQMILQDIRSGFGVFACDPKGDLVEEICARLSDEDAERVVVVTPAQRDRPIGFNPLSVPNWRDEQARELVADGVLHIFKSLWADSWGPRSDQIMRAVLATLTSTRAPDGSAFTLCEAVPLLTRPAFRRFVVAQPSLPDHVRDFWHWYEGLTAGEAAQAIAPVVNKIDAFTHRSGIRLLLGQSQGLDLGDVFRRRSVVLVSLAKGALGPDTSNLLGALLVHSLWNACLARVAVSPKKRRPVFAHLDEAADIVRLPVPLDDMLSQARGLGMGVQLAGQYAAQLPESVKAAVLGTVRTQLTFATEYEDAKLLERRFAPLTAADLQGLGRYEIAMRPCVDGQTLAPVTGVTLQLEPPIRNGAELGQRSRQRYGVDRADVEAALRARVDVGPAPSNRIGRTRRGEAS
ncbi:type IV secretory system conjugative DNA transfer family protein [Streptomyces olivoreticuli]